MQGAGRSHDDRPHPHAHRNTAEVFRRTGDGVHQREKRDIYRTEIRRAGEIFQRSEFLGTRVFRLDGRQERGDDTEVHPKSGSRGQEAGSESGIIPRTEIEL